MRLSKKQEDPLVSKARKRVRMLATPDLLNWADQAGSGVARAFDDYRRTSAPEALTDARAGLQALLVLVEELESRD